MSLTAVVFVVLYFGLLVAALVKRPFFGLCAYLMAFYLHPPARWWGEALPDLRWSLTAAAVTLLAVLIKGGRFEPFRFPETRLYAAFFAFVALQTLWAADSTYHIDFVGMAFNFLMLMYLIQSAVRDEKELTAFILVTMVGCSYFAYLGSTQSWGGRLDGVGGPSIASANQMAQHVAAMLVCGAFLLLLKGRRWWEYLVVLLLSAACLKAVLMAGSRGVYLAILVTGTVALLLPAKASSRRFYTLAILGVVGGLVVLGPTLMQRFEGVRLAQLGEAEDQSARSRVVFISAQWEMFKTAPLLGHGHKGTLVLSPAYIPPEYLTVVEGKRAGRASHNYLMSLLVDHGLIGATLVLLIIYRCVVPLRRLSRMPLEGEVDQLRLLLMGLMMGLICLMVAGMASDHKNSETSIWFFALIPLFLEKLKVKTHAV
jgi:O-antigen ligase